MLAWTEITIEERQEPPQTIESPLHYAAAVVGSSVVLRVYDPERSRRSYSLTSIPFHNQSAAEVWVEQNKTAEYQVHDGWSLA